MTVPELPLEPKETPPVGFCAWCGAEVYPGERVFAGDEGKIHIGCMMELLSEQLGEEYLAELCGYRAVTA